MTYKELQAEVNRKVNPAHRRLTLLSDLLEREGLKDYSKEVSRIAKELDSVHHDLFVTLRGLEQVAGPVE